MCMAWVGLTIWVFVGPFRKTLKPLFYKTFKSLYGRILLQHGLKLIIYSFIRNMKLKNWRKWFHLESSSNTLTSSFQRTNCIEFESEHSQTFVIEKNGKRVSALTEVPDNKNMERNISCRKKKNEDIWNKRHFFVIPGDTINAKYWLSRLQSHVLRP